jgi:UDP-N-acetylmuramoyl-L-alanyl-D-glutamate--2,6-diaminopimelate ligase
MKFSEMVLKTENEITDVDVKLDFEINKLCYSSSLVEQGDVFFAIKGFKTDGNKFIDDAFARGAGAVFTDAVENAEETRIYKVENCRKAMATMSNTFYGYPSRKMKVIGVTGTNGKTTITNIINTVLEFWGKKTGLIGTNGNFINKRFIQTSFTTPESVELNALLKDMHEAGAEYVTMEVSSHSLALSRVYGIDFDVAVFTNLTEDHLDFHETMDDYFEAKKIMFDSIPRINAKGNNTAAIYNSDDEYGKRIVEGTGAERISFGFSKAMYSVENLKMDFDGMKFDMLVPLNGEKTNKVKIETNLIGRFNVYNILSASAALKYLKVPFDVIAGGIKSFNAVDGRFNLIKLKNGVVAIIDYSHTPDALLKALTAIREILDETGSKGKIITVFGCGGNRDKMKRPLMGKIAVEIGSYAIITSDNPRDEEPIDIIEEIKKGITSDNYSVEENREKAIEEAVNMSAKGDIILIAGKGHEMYQEIKGVKHHFSDREIAERFV